MTEFKPMRMVAGFLFYRSHVLLVKKTKPDWQAGLLNAIGGKIEEDDSSPEAAMRREFEEETGIEVREWHQLAVERGQDPDYEVTFFHSRIPEAYPRPTPPMTNDAGELLGWVHTVGFDGLRCVGNLNWLVPLALDWRMCRAEVWTGAHIKSRPTW